MRVGVSSRGNWWVSMGPIGWAVYLVLVLPVLLVVWLAVALVQVVAWCVQVSRESRQRG